MDRTYTVQVAQNFERTIGRSTANGQRQTAICAKVVVVSTVMVAGLGSHTGVGEGWADDENSATRAEAQAFKHAHACFGLGRYLYDLGKIWEDLDQYGRPVRTPVLPEWAVPVQMRRPVERQQIARGGQPRQGIVQQETLAGVKRLCDVVGVGLTKWTLQKYAGVTDVSKIRFAKLTLVLEKLTDLSRGIERLIAASSTLSSERYCEICSELSLSSESIDGIENRNMLSRLLARVEGEGTKGK